MNDGDIPKFRKVMAVLYVTFQRDPDPVLGDAYFHALKDLPIDHIEKASILATRQLKFFPKPAELRELVQGPPLAVADLKDEAEVAAGKAFRSIPDVGQYRSVVFDDPAIHLTIQDLGGWGAFCRGPDNTFQRKEFKATYVAHRKRIAFDGLASCRVPQVLYGEHGDNAPKIVGDKGKVIAWRNEALGLPPGEEAKRLEGESR